MEHGTKWIGNTGYPLLKKARHFCFTSFDKPEYKDEHIRYMVYQLERCPTTNKEHYQGYIEFDKPYTLNMLKKIDDKAHWEQRRGTREQAREYCMKTDTRISEPIEYGEWICGQGHRTDLHNAIDMIKEGKNYREICEELPLAVAKYSRGIKEVMNTLRNHKRDRPQEVIVLIGQAGCGKSRYIYEHEGIDDVYKLDHCNSGNIWYDGYDGERVLWIDDFYGWIAYGSLLNILDRYPLKIETKGSYTWANWDKVYITSNKPPKDWYKMGMTPALDRRINKIILLEDDI